MQVFIEIHEGHVVHASGYSDACVSHGTCEWVYQCMQVMWLMQVVMVLMHAGHVVHANGFSNVCGFCGAYECEWV